MVRLSASQRLSGRSLGRSACVAPRSAPPVCCWPVCCWPFVCCVCCWLCCDEVVADCPVLPPCPDCAACCADDWPVWLPASAMGRVFDASGHVAHQIAG